MDYHARIARLTALEARYIKQMRRALVVSAERAVAAHLAGASPELAAAMVTSARVIEVLEKLYVTCGDTEARIQYEELTPATKALAPPAVISRWGQRLRQFITTEGAAAVRGITETTRRIVRQALTESAAAGDGIAVAARRLRERVATLAPQRAVRIVRTELVAASNVGSLLGAEATGLKLEKFWIATPDGRTRPDHARANGQGAPLQAGFFQVGGYRCRYPGDPLLPASERCNCRCAVGYRKPL